MTLSFQVLGDAGRDNALLVKVDSGQAVSRLLIPLRLPSPTPPANHLDSPLL